MFKKDNQCIDKLAEFGTRSKDYVWWDNVPNFICPKLFKDRFDLPFYWVRD